MYRLFDFPHKCFFNFMIIIIIYFFLNILCLLYLNFLVSEDELKKLFKLKKVKVAHTLSSKSMSFRYSDRESAGPSESMHSSKRSTVGPQTFAEAKSILESQIANRQYQLANALILQAEKKRVNNWDEVIKRLGKVLRIDFDNKKKNVQRIVKSHIIISNAFLGCLIFLFLNKRLVYFCIFI